VRIGRYEFRPGRYPTLAYLLLLPLLLSLAWWQWQRAAEKEGMLLERARGLAIGQVQSLNETAPGALHPYGEVVASGHFDRDHYWLQDNRLYHGAPGYHVYALFLLDDGRGVLVNRGWIPVGRDRRLLPDVSIESPVTRIRGRLGRPASVGMTLGDLDKAYRGLTAVVPKIDPRRIERITGVELLPWVVFLDETHPLAYTPVWSRPNVMGPEKHRGYAAQWMAMAVALTVIFVAVNLKKIR
jgi:surfeit locus 1 family protein